MEAILSASATAVRRNMSGVAGGDDVELESNGAGRGARRRFGQSAATLNRLVYLRGQIRMAVTIMAYLAFTWSTVVLLGGFVGSIRREDFTILTIITLVEATRIFNDMETDKLHLDDITGFVRNMFFGGRDMFAPSLSQTSSPIVSEQLTALSGLAISGMLMPVVYTVVSVVAILYAYGPFIAFGLSAWRLRYRDYGGADSRNMSAALDIFYRLVLAQGILYAFLSFTQPVDLLAVSDHYGFSDKWGPWSVAQYLKDIREKCTRDPASIVSRNLVQYAVELLGSESWEDYLSGARMLDALTKMGEDVRPLLLPSRPKIQKLIGTLVWRSNPNGNREMRELAARILAGLAGDIQLAHFPGAIRCVSSLLQEDNTHTFWNNRQRPHAETPVTMEDPRLRRIEEMRQKRRLRIEENRRRRRMKKQEGGPQGDVEMLQQEEQVGHSSSGCNELLLQGLTILERLAFDHHNCREICSTPDLVPKIMAPLCSPTFIQDIKVRDWADVVDGSVRVLHQLIIHAPGRTSRRLRRELFSNKQAMCNLKATLEQSTGAGQELQIQAMEIMTELALDVSISFSKKSKENLIDKQLQIFIDDGQAPSTTLNQLKVTAGRMLVLLSTNSESNSDYITGAYDNILSHLTELPDDKKNTVTHLTELLDAKNNTIYRTIAAEILDNLCTHCDWDDRHKQILKESLLPKVFTEILSIKSDQPESKISEEENKPQARRWTLFRRKSNLGNQRNFAPGNEENQKNSAPGKDEENQKQFAWETYEKSQRTPGDKKEMQKTSSSGDKNKSSDQQNKEQTAAMELREVLLSLALVECGKLISAEDVVQVNALVSEAFVVKLKTIIDDNCQPTAHSLRIVKLCGQIAASVIQSQPYAEHFRNKEFVQSLSKASKIMSSLESCMRQASPL